MPHNIAILPILLLASISRQGLVCGDDKDFAEGYLKQFGYVGETASDRDMKAASLYAGDLGPQALQMFQRQMGIPQTGVLDDRTLVEMRKPRCGRKDYEIPDIGRRHKRYSQVASWGAKTHLTYRIEAYTRRLPNNDVDYWIQRAFNVWSSVTSLTFSRVSSGPVDINIKFTRFRHGDGYDFDGPGRTLAHAFYPGEDIGGDTHFDDDEPWVIREYNNIDLFTVAVHEFGHALGLGHSNVRGAIMLPTYAYKDDPKDMLGSDDIAGIQSFYGPGPRTRLQTPRPQTPRPRTPRPRTPGPRTPRPITPRPRTPKPEIPFAPIPEHCFREIRFNAVFTVRSGEVYAFEGWQYVYKWDSRLHPAVGFPRQTSDIFKNLNWGVDAAVSLPEGDQERIYIFKAYYLWVYSGSLELLKELVPIRQEFPGLPNYLDTVFYSKTTGNTIFLKGTEVYSLPFDNYANKPKVVKRQSLDYSRSYFGSSVGSQIDSAMSWRYRLTYIFSGRHYLKYDDITKRVVGRARPIKVWFLGCPDHPQGLNVDQNNLNALEAFEEGGNAGPRVAPTLRLHLVATSLTILVVWLST